mgnify:CR=1 FL=1
MLERFARKVMQVAALAAFLLLPAISSAEEVLLRVGGAVDTPLELTRSDLEAMPRDQFQIPARHDRSVMETWSGVPMIEILRKAGYVEGQNWITKKFEGAEHSEKAWRLRVDQPLVFLIGH